MLFVALVFGELLRRVKQPPLIGQLLAGMLIGPSILNIVQPNNDLYDLVNVGLFFIMFLTGFNLKMDDVIEAGHKAFVISIISFVIPFALGAYVATLFGLTLTVSLVVGLTIAITAVPVNSLILMELGILQTKLGATVITAGVINDILSLIILGVIYELPTGASLVTGYDLAISIIKVFVFVGAILLAMRFISRRKEWITTKVPPLVRSALPYNELMFGMILAIAIGVSLVAEEAGLHFVIGTFFAAMLLSEAFSGGEVMKKANEFTSAISLSFFAPIVFAYIGIEFEAEALPAIIALVGVLLVIAILSKLLGGFVGGRLTGFSIGESRTIGLLMNSRGMVELVIATVAYQAGLINIAIFSAVVGIGVVTTIISASTARLSLRKDNKTITQ
jgi:Kef-type K+ transport system membrane component KefB